MPDIVKFGMALLVGFAAGTFYEWCRIMVENRYWTHRQFLSRWAAVIPKNTDTQDMENISQIIMQYFAAPDRIALYGWWRVIYTNYCSSFHQILKYWLRGVPSRVLSWEEIVDVMQLISRYFEQKEPGESLTTDE